MECKYCQKTFSKGEHLRRHERSRKGSKYPSSDATMRYTGSRPFVCKSCKRPFARQDSLVRHERLHVRRKCIHYASPPSSLVTPPMTVNSPTYLDVGIGNSTASMNGETRDRGRAWIEHESPTNIDIDDVLPSADLDFELMWPDSELLFQTITSLDTANQWPMPLRALPLTPGLHQTGADNFGTPNSFHEKASSIGTIPSGGSHRAVRDVSKLVTSLSSGVTAVAEATSLTSLFLDECLHMFFVRFIPTFPILHRATFVFRDCTHPLLLNAMAIGSLYCGPKDSTAKGEALWRLAHMAVANSWEKLITHRGPNDSCKGIQLVLTALLGQAYGALSKNRDIRMASQAFYALGFFWASQCGMFDIEPYSATDLPSLEDSEEEKEHQWRLWAAKEIQQRALLGYYVLDGLIARMFGRPTSVRHTANQLRLLSGEAAFEANTANEWIICLQSQEAVSYSFRSVFLSLFNATDNELSGYNTSSAFSLRVVLEGLQSLVSDCDKDDATVGVPSKLEIRKALVRVHEQLANSIDLPAADRQELFLRWHAICLDVCVDPSRLCKYVCSRYGIDQHIWEGGQAIKPEFDLIRWASTEDARRALLHAITIQEIVEQLPRGRAHVIHIPSSLFAAATVYTVFSLAGLAQVNLPSIVDWKDVLSKNDDSEFFSADVSNPPISSDTRRYICGEYPSMFGILGATRNLLYELNSMQKLFRCLSSQWGIAYDMEDIMDQWITICR